MNTLVTIFPTHKTELKTKLPRHEILKRLEGNDFYALGYNYKLIKDKEKYFIVPERDVNSYRSHKCSAPPTIHLHINTNIENTKVQLNFFPLTRDIVITASAVATILLFQFIVLFWGNISFISFLPTIFSPIAYLGGFLKFSFEVINIRKQIEEAIEAEIHEVTEDEMSKLQKWYEKKR